jgi:transposase InsO family protein
MGFRTVVLLSCAMSKENVAVEMHLHSDQGFQYTSRVYVDLTEEYSITPSTSRRRNNNALAENFFSILKTECIIARKSTPLFRLSL